MRRDLLPMNLTGKMDHVIEEATEVILAILKYKRFGARAKDPVTGKEYNNEAEILAEMDDLYAAMNRLQDNLSIENLDST